jgi:hypothetical protein
MFSLDFSVPLAVMVLDRLRGADFDEATAGKTSLFLETLDDMEWRNGCKLSAF